MESDDAQEAVACLRVRLQAAFQAWCLDGGQRMPHVLQQALAVIIDIFSVEGATGAELQRGRAVRHGSPSVASRKNVAYCQYGS